MRTQAKGLQAYELRSVVYLCQTTLVTFAPLEHLTVLRAPSSVYSMYECMVGSCFPGQMSVSFPSRLIVFSMHSVL